MAAATTIAMMSAMKMARNSSAVKIPNAAETATAASFTTFTIHAHATLLRLDTFSPEKKINTVAYIYIYIYIYILGRSRFRVQLGPGAVTRV